jgi:membrane protein
MIPLAAKTAKQLVHAAEAVWFYVRGIFRKMREVDLLFLASGLAFNGVLTMIPLMLLSASALGIFLNSSELGLRRLHEILNAIFPPQPFATSIKDSILTMVSEIIAYRTSLGVVGAAVLIWTATSLFDALRSVLHAVYGIRRTRGLLAGLLHDVGFVFLVFLLFLATNISLWAVSVAEGLARRLPALAGVNFEGINETIPTFIVVVLTAGMFYIIYRYIPDSKPPRAAGVISTITSTTVWVVSGRLFAIYLSRFSAIATVYGPYAFILVLLFWIYYSSLIFIFGGIVGQVYWERRRLRESGRLVRWI